MKAALTNLYANHQDKIEYARLFCIGTAADFKSVWNSHPNVLVWCGVALAIAVAV